MEGIFLGILNMSLAAALLALPVLLLRLLLQKHIPRRFICWLWAAVFVRMAVPAYFSAGFSFFNLSVAGPAAAQVGPRIEQASRYLPLVKVDYLPEVQGAAQAAGPVWIAAAVWAMVAAALLVFFTAFYLRACAKLRDASRYPGDVLVQECAAAAGLRRCPKVFRSANVESPVVCGTVFPKVILPAALVETADEQTLRMVLAHEMAHIRRRDCFTKPLMLAVACLHWFNPMAWLCFFLAVRDMELACDERVLRGAKEDIRKSYAGTLYEMAVADTALRRFGLPAFGESAVKSRVVSIVRYRRSPLWVSLLSVLLVACVMLCALSNPALVFAAGQAPSIVVEGLYDQMSRPEQPVWVPYEELPKDLVNAVVAVEDRRFWEHGGVDWKRTTGAAINLFVPVYWGPSGGSTITQQLVKIATGDNEVSIKRKLREINTAQLVERAYSKNEILEAYLNQVYYGENTYGIGNAALVYFGRSLSELNLTELTALVVIPQYPQRYSLYVHPEQNAQRRKDVLYEMVNQGYLSPEAAQEASERELVLAANR